MASKVKVVEKNQGQKIVWKQSTTKLTFGDDELMVNVARYQKDWPVQIDICGDKDGNLVLGVGEGRYYVAQVDIPATAYTEPQPIEPENEVKAQSETDAMEDASESSAEMGTYGGMQQRFTPPEPIPLEMSDVVLTLWAIDGLRN